MDPQGNFHKLIEEENKNSEQLHALLEQEKAKLNKGGRYPLHPKHRRMVLEANKRPVPKNWPIFAIGEVYEVGDTKIEVVSISTKDLSVKTNEGAMLERDDIVMLQKRQFKVRFTRWARGQPPITVLRPVKGRVARA